MAVGAHWKGKGGWKIWKTGKGWEYTHPELGSLGTVVKEDGNYHAWGLTPQEGESTWLHEDWGTYGTLWEAKAAVEANR